MRADAPTFEPPSSAKFAVPPGLGPPSLRDSFVEADIGTRDLEFVGAPPGLSAWQSSAPQLVDDSSGSAYKEGLWFDESLWAYAACLNDGILAAQFLSRGLPTLRALRCCKDRPSVDASDASSDTMSTTDTSHEGLVEELVLEALVANLHGGVDEQQQALGCICENVKPLCKTQQGSRLVQEALELAQGSQLEAIVNQFRSTVLEMSKSLHGNYIMAKCIDVVGSDKAQFIVDEMKGKAVVIARDRFGCRVIKQLVERCPQEQVSCLIDELMTDGPRLLKHPFANFAMQSVIRLGASGRRSQIVDFLLEDPRGYSRHRVGKHVLRLAAEHCCPTDKERIEAAFR